MNDTRKLENYIIELEDRLEESQASNLCLNANNCIIKNLIYEWVGELNECLCEKDVYEITDKMCKWVLR